MRIKFERSGGFAGLTLSKEIDVSKLKPAEAKKVEGLIHSSQFFKLPKKPMTAAAAKRSIAQPDRFQYTVTIEDDHKKHTVIASDQNLPADLKPLVEFLSAAAKEKADPS